MGAVAEAEETRLEPSLAGDVAGGTSNEYTSKLETEDEVEPGEIEEQEDFFASDLKAMGAM